MGASDIMTSFGSGSPLWAAGHKDVIKMEFYLGYGSMDSYPMPSTALAWTTSFEVGISLSEITWGFHNTAFSKQASRIEFTLHDIAGDMLETFLEIRRGDTVIYFKGPGSDGKKWSGEYAAYKPVSDDCDMEFSPSQGFTYKFVGSSINKLVDTKFLSLHSKIIVNGTGTSNAKHGNIFEDYLKEVEEKWNDKLSDHPSKTATAQIKFIIDKSVGVNDLMAKQTPWMVEKEKKGNTLVTGGNAGVYIQPFEMNSMASIGSEVRRLWQERFVSNETGSSRAIDSNSQLEVNYRNYEGGINFIDIKLQRKNETDKTTGFNETVCIGSDITCKGYPYRANLVGLNFEGLFNILSVDQLKVNQESSTGEVFIGGGESVIVSPAENELTIDELQEHETFSNISFAAPKPSGNNNSFDGLGRLNSFLNAHHNASLTVDVEFAYTFGFTPVVHGGKLLDATPGFVNGGILATEGVHIQLYWYDTIECSNLVLMPAFSRFYRITEVSHTIGLNGNTTQVKLSHQNVTK